MKNLRPYLIFDRNINSKKIKNKLIKRLVNFHLNNLISLLSLEDGFMLQTLKKYYKKKIFLWN